MPQKILIFLLMLLLLSLPKISETRRAWKYVKKKKPPMLANIPYLSTISCDAITETRLPGLFVIVGIVVAISSVPFMFLGQILIAYTLWYFGVFIVYVSQAIQEYIFASLLDMSFGYKLMAILFPVVSPILIRNYIPLFVSINEDNISGRF